MPVTNTGTPPGPSRRSPSPELAAAAGRATDASMRTAINARRSTVPELTALRPLSYPASTHPPLRGSARITTNPFIRADTAVRYERPPLSGTVRARPPLRGSARRAPSLYFLVDPPGGTSGHRRATRSGLDRRFAAPLERAICFHFVG